MDAIKFLEERKRMCYSFGGFSCEGCPIYRNAGEMGCATFRSYYPEQAVAIVEKWSAEHPQKTRKDDFFEKFPYAKKLCDGIPEVCAAKVGYLCECPHPNVENYCKECWNTALEEKQTEGKGEEK